MANRKILNVLVLVSMLASLLVMSGASPVGASISQDPTAAASSRTVAAAPISPTDETKVPHYFGPYPNWANSPMIMPDVAVAITGPGGTGAEATATIGANGIITGITLTKPGVGYTSAAVAITKADGTAAADPATATATVAASGSVTSITVDVPGSGYTAPTVSFSGGGGAGTLVQVGNPLTARAFATDFATPPGTLGPVFVVVPTPMPAAGTVQSIQYFNQATTGGSPTSSAGNLFHAYVLQATGVANQYTVVWDSGELTVPTTADPVGVTETIPVPNVPVTTNDRIAFYGEGIPLDDLGTGADILSTPAPTAPLLGGTFTLGGAGFPILNQTRTYSFAASVLDSSGVVPLTPATATAYGSVDLVTLDFAGSGYHMPTVDFDMPDDPAGVQAKAHAVCVEANCAPLTDGATVTITGITVDNPGSGYSHAPNVVIRDGTLADPVRNSPGSGATATATLTITGITVDTPGDGYISAPLVTIGGASTAPASATAHVNAGAITSLTLTAPGSGYLTGTGIKKFEDPLPGLCVPPACAATGKYIPVAVPEVKTYNGVEADEYVIGLVQYRTSFSSSLPPTLVRGYVQLETPANAGISQHFPVTNELMNGTKVPVLQSGGAQWLAVTPPQWLGPTIVSTKDRPVRIVFYNLLPTGAEGDLFLPTDSSLMGSGEGLAGPAHADGQSVLDAVRNPECSQYPKPDTCFADNRATLHLHGGTSPWISDGTPHQWITPANETTPWPQGVSVESVPDMNVCQGDRDGCMTFYYTNQQSARLMFYHDHAWGITRLNVYAGEAAGYLITDDTEKKLITNGTIPGSADTIPLIVQDRTFVPDAKQLADQDPTWDTTRWGGYGDFWYHHVYMPAQNPGDPGGMSAYGRWMYGPWFWPPATPPYGPIPNPYYNMDPNANPPFSQPLAVACNLDDQTTWQYQTDPFCEPQYIPGTPNISVGMEQFNDTPVVNGTAYPTITLEPKTYRFRVLNAANDRFFNFQWYVGEAATASTAVNKAGQAIGPTEVALKPAEVLAAQTDPVVFPTPVDANNNLAGPDWIQIGSEGGFLPAPTVVDGQQPTTWITDPTRFDVGNVDLHSLLLAPAERADVIVDFSKFAGQTLILYNDAPAAFPARVPSYDYYTGYPDMWPNGPAAILPGYGPNTRTIMQVKIAGTAKPAFNLAALRTAFSHKADGSGVFESGQHPIIVGQAAYNSAYGTSFAASSWCNATGSTTNRCDGYARISDQGGDLFGFNTLQAPAAKMQIKLEPKAIHDEMNSAAFDEFGRMTANLGLEAVPATPALQNVILYPYVNPSTELINATNLPKLDQAGLENGFKITPISSAADGSQIWKITHNGVDTHPIHFHLYDVQVLNRVTWDNIIIPPDPAELGWKDTVRISPLEDTIVALRPIIPWTPFELPNAIRPLNPMQPAGSSVGFNNVDAGGNPTTAISNQLVNFGWEYVYHCHILSHEEMDMMRPVSVAMPPLKPDGLAYSISGNGNNTVLTLTWNDNSISETSFVVQNTTDGVAWNTIGTVPSPLDQPNIHQVRTYDDTAYRTNGNILGYRVKAMNTVGYGGEFMSLAVESISPVMAVIAAPTNLAATLLAGPGVSLTWTDNATNETGFVVERQTNGAGAFVQIATPGPRNNTGSVTYVDTTVVLGNTYTYRVAAVSSLGGVLSAYSNAVTVAVTVPAAPSNFAAARGANQGNNRRVVLNWTDNANNESGFTIQRATNAAFTTGLNTANVGANVITLTQTGLARNTQYWYRIRANNVLGSSAWVNATPFPIRTNP